MLLAGESGGVDIDGVGIGYNPPYLLPLISWEGDISLAIIVRMTLHFAAEGSKAWGWLSPLSREKLFSTFSRLIARVEFLNRKYKSNPKIGAST